MGIILLMRSTFFVSMEFKSLETGHTGSMKSFWVFLTQLLHPPMLR